MDLTALAPLRQPTRAAPAQARKGSELPDCQKIRNTTPSQKAAQSRMTPMRNSRPTRSVLAREGSSRPFSAWGWSGRSRPSSTAITSKLIPSPINHAASGQCRNQVATWSSVAAKSRVSLRHHRGWCGLLPSRAGPNGSCRLIAGRGWPGAPAVSLGSPEVAASAGRSGISVASVTGQGREPHVRPLAASRWPADW